MAPQGRTWSRRPPSPSWCPRDDGCEAGPLAHEDSTLAYTGKSSGNRQRTASSAGGSRRRMALFSRNDRAQRGAPRGGSSLSWAVLRTWRLPRGPGPEPRETGGRHRTQGRRWGGSRAGPGGGVRQASRAGRTAKTPHRHLPGSGPRKTPPGLRMRPRHIGRSASATWGGTLGGTETVLSLMGTGGGTLLCPHH